MPKIVMQGELTKQGLQVRNWKLRCTEKGPKNHCGTDLFPISGFTLDVHSVLRYYTDQVPRETEWQWTELELRMRIVL